MSNKPLLFPTEDDAVTYLMLMGFTVEGDRITSDGTEIATHRVLHAIDWLLGKGFTYERAGSTIKGSDMGEILRTKEEN